VTVKTLIILQNTSAQLFSGLVIIRKSFLGIKSAY